MFCPNCGKELRDGAQFCAFCGKQVKINPNQTSPKVNPQPNPPVTEEDTIGILRRPAVQNPPVPGPTQIPTPPIANPPIRNPQPVQEPINRPSDPVPPAPGFRAPVNPPRYPNGPTQPVPAVAEKSKASRPSGGLRAVTCILCVLLLLLGLCASILGAVRITFNPDALYYHIQGMDLSDIKMTDASGNSVSLGKYIQDVCEIDFQEEYGIDEAELTNLVNADFVKRFVADNVANYADTLFNGAALKPLDRNTLVNFLRANDTEIKRLTGYSFVEYEYAGQMDKINEYLDEYSLDGIFNELGTRTLDQTFLEKELGVDFSPIQTILSLWLVLALAGVCLLLILLIFVLLHKFPRSALNRVGITLLILGILNLLLGAAGFIALLATGLGAVLALVKPILIALLIIGGSELLIGVVLILLKGLVRKHA